LRRTLDVLCCKPVVGVSVHVLEGKMACPIDTNLDKASKCIMADTQPIRLRSRGYDVCGRRGYACLYDCFIFLIITNVRKYWDVVSGIARVRQFIPQVMDH